MQGCGSKPGIRSLSPLLRRRSARRSAAASASASASRLGLGLFLQQRLPVRDRDLVVVGMDFVEGEEAVAVAAVVDEGGLQ